MPPSLPGANRHWSIDLIPKLAQHQGKLVNLLMLLKLDGYTTGKQLTQVLSTQWTLYLLTLSIHISKVWKQQCYRVLCTINCSLRRVMMLGKAVDEILFDGQGKVIGVICGEELVKASKIISHPSYARDIEKIRTNRKT